MRKNRSGHRLTRRKVADNRAPPARPKEMLMAEAMTPSRDFALSAATARTTPATSLIKPLPSRLL